MEKQHTSPDMWKELMASKRVRVRKAAETFFRAAFRRKEGVKAKRTGLCANDSVLKSKGWRHRTPSEVWESSSGDKKLRGYWQLASLMWGGDDHRGKCLSKSSSKHSRERCKR